MGRSDRRGWVAGASENCEVSGDIVGSGGRRVGQRLDKAVKNAEASVDILDRDRVTLGLVALAGHERDTILARMRERTISARTADTPSLIHISQPTRPH